MYRQLVNQIVSLKLQVKVFIWYFLKGAILTKGNLLKRNNIAMVGMSPWNASNAKNQLQISIYLHNTY